MGDPLSVTASAASLLALGLQSAEYLYKYYTRFHGQDQELTRTTDKLGLLLESLQDIDNLIRTHTWRPDEHSSVKTLKKSIIGCDGIITFLRDEVDKFKKEPTDNWKTKVVVGGRRAAYPFKRSTLQDLAEEVNEFRDNLSIALQALQLKEHQNTQNDIEEATVILRSIQVHDVSTSIRLWLKSPDPTVDLNIASSLRYADTGKWFVQGSAYTDWLNLDNSFLWLYGFAGCGKSVLCSTAIHHALRRRQESAESAAAFFFFTFRDEAKQDASAALKSILLQLCGQVSGLESDLDRLKTSSNSATPSLTVLLEHVRQTVTRCRHVYILLDALDECPSNYPRREVLRVIETMRHWRLPGLHLLVTSRNEPDIRCHLECDTLSLNDKHIELKNDSVEQDIARYLSYQVESDPQLRRWGEHREKIKIYLSQHANGVFRWVECQLQPLRQCPHSEKRLDKCLGSLPKSLYETYERILCNIDSPEEARQLLSLLCFASRPLHVDEVIEALAVDIDGLGRYDPASRFNDGADDLARICPGLIEIDFDEDEAKYQAEYEAEHAPQSETDEKGKKDNQWLVRIAHYSVQEYLLSDAIAVSRASNFALSAPSQHGRLSKVCLLYLETSDFEQMNHTYELSTLYAFAYYAAQNWYHHHQQADDHSVQRLIGPIVTLLTTIHIRSPWIQQVIRLSSPVTEFYHGSAICFASSLGLNFVLAELLTLPVAMALAPEFQSHNPLQGALQEASGNGHKATVEMLLDNNANINEDGKDGTALVAASRNGHVEVVQVLLQNGADINAQDRTWGTALVAASVRGHVEVMQVLLQNGADINAQGGRYGSALIVASAIGHIGVVQVLLQNGADINAQGMRYGSALIAASNYGNASVVRMLLNHGAEVNQTWKSGITALETAAAIGHIEEVQILLVKVIEVDSTGSDLYPAICEAFLNAQTDVLEMLFDHARHIDLSKLAQLLIGRSEKYSQRLDGDWEFRPRVDLSESWRSSAAQMAEAGDHEGFLRIMQERMTMMVQRRRRPYEYTTGTLGSAMASEWDLGSSSFNCGIHELRRCYSLP